MTVYVKRDENQQIVALFNQAQSGVEESLDINHPDVVNFLSACSSDEAKAQFLQSDMQFIRVIEDLVEILLHKNVITITDFPPSVIEKLMQRRGIRTQLDGISGIIDTHDIPNS